MSGRYNGLQARIKEKNPLADYVPCFAHSLNLVGQSAVEKVSGAARFFNLVDYVYTCFSASTHRWSVLLDALDGLPVVKQLSDTQWSAHADATKEDMIRFPRPYATLLTTTRRHRQPDKKPLDF